MTGRERPLGEDGLRRLRTAAQLLHRPRRMKPADLVRHLLGVQAQVLSAAGLALRTRTEGLTAARVDRARLRDRSIVLTWAMRGTLHLIATEDYGWLTPLVVEKQVATSHRRLHQMGVSGDQSSRGVRAIVQMVTRDGPLTRAEIAAGLGRLGLPTRGQITPHLIWLAASEGAVCYGPDRGRDRCFVLVRDWMGEPRTMDREAAQAELVVRYLTAHGPAEPGDVAFWSGLRMSDVRRGWQRIEDRLAEIESHGRRLWMLKSQKDPTPPGVVRLLPNFDEYALGWKDRTFIAPREQWRNVNPGAGWFHPVVLADGRAVGTWKTDRKKDGLLVTVEPFFRLTTTARRGVAKEAADVGRFLGIPRTRLTISTT